MLDEPPKTNPMTRIGALLADLFCQSLSGGDSYFKQEAGTASIEEATRVA